LIPEEKSDVIEYMEVKQEIARLLAERHVLARLAAFERQIEELEDQQRLEGRLWIPWPMYIR